MSRTITTGLDTEGRSKILLTWSRGKTGQRTTSLMIYRLTGMVLSRVILVAAIDRKVRFAGALDTEGTFFGLGKAVKLAKS